MRQPLRIMQAIANALIQWVIRTTRGWIGLAPGAMLCFLFGHGCVPSRLLRPRAAQSYRDNRQHENVSWPPGRRRTRFSLPITFR